MKSFTNKTEDIVKEAIDGLLVNPKLAKLDRFPEVKVVVRKHWDKSKVALISGGGSGHEPAHAGFVGEGMLTAAVCGEVFASPSVDAVLSAIMAVTGDAGCLLIIKNYTGDRLNFGLAAEQARALGFKVETVTVDDDIALGETVKRRGIAGTVFVHKIAGYCAQMGHSLAEVKKMAQEVVDNVASIGVAYSECQMFGGHKEVRLNKEEVEIGLGIHGEPGAEVISMITADELMRLICDKIKIHFNDPNAKYAIMLNNLGTVTPIEMNVLSNSLMKTQLASSIQYLVGPGSFMTALNMGGFSLSVLRLSDTIEKALIAKVEPSAWLNPVNVGKPCVIASPQLDALIPFESSSNDVHRSIIEKVAHTFIEIEKDINALDAKVGDGDAGATFASASKTVLRLMDELPLNDVQHLLESIGRIFSREAGGSSGVLMSILFIGAANDFEDSKHIGKALLGGLNRMKQYGGAKVGDRTMIDSLEPAFTSMAQDKSIKDVAKAARTGAESTKLVTKTAYGRSSYVPEELLQGIADPGAEAMTRIFEMLAES